MGGDFSFEMSRCLCFWLVFGSFFSFSLTIAHTRWWWSLKMSAPQKILTSLRDPRHLPLIITWSICLDVFPSGDPQVSLRMVLCEKMVPPMTQLFVAQKSIIISQGLIDSNSIKVLAFSFDIIRATSWVWVEYGYLFIPLSCSWWLPHGLDVPCANFEVVFWPEQTGRFSHPWLPVGFHHHSASRGA